MSQKLEELANADPEALDEFAKELFSRLQRYACASCRCDVAAAETGAAHRRGALPLTCVLPVRQRKAPEHHHARGGPAERRRGRRAAGAGGRQGHAEPRRRLPAQPVEAALDPRQQPRFVTYPV